MKRKHVKIGDYYIIHDTGKVCKVTRDPTLLVYWDELVNCTPLNICKLTRLIYDIKD